MHAHSRLILTALAFSVALVASSCGSSGGVQATLKDFAIDLSAGTAAAGDVTFDITNQGPSTHEFVVLETSLGPADLPTDDTGTVDEAGAPGISVVDEVEDIASGDTATLAVQMNAGSYVVICNIPGHYGLGMRAGFTVS
jgi:uncharacterized cupredoxin-like copper-binding protein